MRLRDLSVTLDDGTAVVDDTEVVIKKGERVLVAGETGTGKSTLVRAIAGLWPWGGGEIDIQKDARLFLLPQRPYMPTGTLRRAVGLSGRCGGLAYRKKIAEALRKVGLGHLKDRHRGGCALGPDAVGRREAAADFRARVAASSRHHRARRGDLGARSEEPGHADEASDPMRWQG